jgi:cytochrome oxidase Cu insertion factor (SCO1/SenC/PrrC family)
MENKAEDDSGKDEYTLSYLSSPNDQNRHITGIHSNDSGFVKSYFQFYSKLLNQQNMLQDYVRTNAYFSAIKNNLYVNNIIMYSLVMISLIKKYLT